jgi:uncharacterized GH25 family protein
MRAAIRAQCIAAALAALVVAPTLLAHEFWIEPERFRPPAGSAVPVRLLVGQKFKGESQPYLPESFERFTLGDARGVRPVAGIPGDDPAASVTFSSPGLAILAYHSRRYPLTFDTLEEFERYVRTEGLEAILERHRALGKPTKMIRERYTRCAKALVAVGDARGADRALGLPLELIAEANPYRLAPGAPLPVRLLYRGRPLAGALVIAMRKTAPEPRLEVRTDADGRARLALAGRGPWLVNAVHMFIPTDRDSDWESYWASLTFERP